jgi:hypothetical protein
MAIKKIWVLLAFLFVCTAKAESPWPTVQSNMYPYISGMVLTRHEQTILLGEGDQQTGIFFSTLKNAFTEQVQNELINDGFLKSWSLHSLVRLGTSYVITFFQGPRILDIRLTNTPKGVEAVYSMVLNQSYKKDQPLVTPLEPLNKQDSGRSELTNQDGQLTLNAVTKNTFARQTQTKFQE